MATSLKTEKVKIDTLRPHPRNARNGDTDAIAESLRVNGQYRAIVVADDGTILAGNHTYAAAMELGWATIEVHRLPIGPDSIEATRIMLADNKVADKGRYDNGLLLELLSDLDGAAGLTGSGYTTQDVDNLLARIEESQAPIDGKPMGQRITPSLGELAEKFLEKASRHLMLEFPNADFVWVIDALDTIRKDLGAESNSEAILALLRKYVDDR